MSVLFQVVGQDEETGDIQLKFLRFRGTHYTWPEMEDVAWVSHSQILSFLGHPDISSRGQYTFLNWWKWLLIFGQFRQDWVLNSSIYLRDEYLVGGICGLMALLFQSQVCKVFLLCNSVETTNVISITYRYFLNLWYFIICILILFLHDLKQENNEPNNN